jgi:hypothetical protein
VLVCKTIRSVVKPTLDHKKSLEFETSVDKLLRSYTHSILSDQGEGSICKNILKINARLEKLLKIKVDLTRPDQMAAQ